MSLYYEETGNKDAPAIVFIHGGGMSGWMWSNQTEYFKDFHCIIPHLPEHGKSLNEKPFSIEDSASRIVELIKAKAPQSRAHVIGHSIGAKILIKMLDTAPEVVDHAVIASALCRPMMLLNLTTNKPAYMLTVQMLKSNYIAKLQAKQFGFTDEASMQNYIKEARSLSVDTLDRVYKEMLKSMGVPYSFSGVNSQVLIMAGEKEPKAMRESVNDLVAAIPGSKGIILKNGLHTYPWVFSDTFNKVVMCWLRDEAIVNEGVINS